MKICFCGILVFVLSSISMARLTQGVAYAMLTIQANKVIAILPENHHLNISKKLQE